jgi:hypothetical protein
MNSPLQNFKVMSHHGKNIFILYGKIFVYLFLSKTTIAFDSKLGWLEYSLNSALPNAQNYCHDGT